MNTKKFHIFYENRSKEYENLLELVDELKSTKREYGFYVEEDELDNMFPDRHDEDFDEDDINYDNIFKKD